MTNGALVHRVYKIASVVALSASFTGLALLFTQRFESEAPADEILRASCCYGVLPPVW
jgi:hypothetical protein